MRWLVLVALFAGGCGDATPTGQTATQIDAHYGPQVRAAAMENVSAARLPPSPPSP